MKYAKLQMPRLSYVPWLLAASLMFGWAGEAPAQNILGSFDPGFVHEAGGAQDITVTIETEGGAAAKADITVQVLFDYASQTARYRDDLFTLSTMPTLTIKQGAKKVTGTFTITPIANDRIGPTPANPTKSVNLMRKVFDKNTRVARGLSEHVDEFDSLNVAVNIPIIFKFIADGSSKRVSFDKNVIKRAHKEGGGYEYFPFVSLIDDDSLPRAVDLSFDPSKLSKQADATSIEVTGTLNGRSLPDTTLSTRLVVAGSDTLKRDEHYTLSGLGKLTIPQGTMSGKTTFTLDPNGTKDGALVIGPSSDTLMTVVVSKRTHTYNGKTVPVRIDAARDGSLDDDGLANIGVYECIGIDGGYSTYGVDLNGDGDVGSDADSNGTIGASEADEIPAGTVLVEKALGIDFFEDGDLLDVFVVPSGQEIIETGLIIRSATSSGWGPNWVTTTAKGHRVGEANYLKGCVDINGDGDFDDVITFGNPLKHLTSWVYPIVVNKGTITIEADPIAKVKSFTLAPAAIRENAGATDVTMTVELEKALNKAQRVDFEITPGVGTRDEHYTVQVTEGLTIPAGDTKGTAMLRVTPIDDSDKNAARTFTVKAKVGDDDTQMKNEEFKITDDETLSENITLKVSPSEIKEDAGATTITVTGTLDGNHV